MLKMKKLRANVAAIEDAAQPLQEYSEKVDTRTPDGAPQVALHSDLSVERTAAQEMRDLTQVNMQQIKVQTKVSDDTLANQDMENIQPEDAGLSSP